MDSFKRASLSIRRKKVRSFTLALIMMLIFSALIGEATVRKVIEELKQSLNKNFQAGFSLESESSKIKLEDAKKIAKIEGIEKTNLQTTELAKVQKNELVQIKNQNINLEKVPAGTETQVVFLNRVKLQADFLSGRNEIIEGKDFEKEADDEVIVHEEFAKLNKLKLGDKIQIELSQKKIDLKVVGIFTGKNKEQVVFPAEGIENRLFVNFKVLKKYQENPEIQTVDYFVRDPKQVDEIIKRAKQVDLDWGKMRILNNFEKNASTYQMIENVEKMLGMMLAGISIVGILILGFVLLFWFRGRIHEIGTLIAIGKTKIEIFLQLLMELLIIALISFMPAILIGNSTSGILTNTVFEQTAMEQNELSEMERDGKSFKNELRITDYVRIYMFGMMVILLAISTSSISTFRLTPKQILTKMK